MSVRESVVIMKKGLDALIWKPQSEMNLEYWWKYHMGFLEPIKSQTMPLHPEDNGLSIYIG